VFEAPVHVATDTTMGRGGVRLSSDWGHPQLGQGHLGQAMSGNLSTIGSHMCHHQSGYIGGKAPGDKPQDTRQSPSCPREEQPWLTLPAISASSLLQV
jgi:hypothetical protein